MNINVNHQTNPVDIRSGSNSVYHVTVTVFSTAGGKKYELFSDRPKFNKVAAMKMADMKMTALKMADRMFIHPGKMARTTILENLP